MSEPMTLERFQELADAYGGTIARWPAPARDAARQMALQPAAMRILVSASALDEALDLWTVPAPSRALRDRALAGASSPARRLTVRARLWWSGVGIAAALAGAASGTAAVMMISPFDIAPDNITSFGDVAGQEG